MRFIIGLMLAFIGLVSTAGAHEVRPAIAQVETGRSEVTVTLSMTLEPVVAGMSLAGLSDTNDNPLSERYDALRALPPEALRAEFDAIWPSFRDRLFVRAGEMPITLDLVAVEIPEVGDIELPRDALLTLRADLPDDDSLVFTGWDASLGILVVRHEANGQRYGVLLQDGAMSEGLPRDLGLNRPLAETFAEAVIAGFDQILPFGLDHILFILAMFFFALAWVPILSQMAAFSLALVVSIGAAGLAGASLPPQIAQPLIAASVAYLALENITAKGQMTPWRLGMVFAFGLAHGFGMAASPGFPQGALVPVVGFLLGVILCQIAVMVLAYLILGWPFGQQVWYRRTVQVPASVFLTVIGLYWTAERIGLI